MLLTKKQLLDIKEKVSKGKELEDILLSEFSNADIAIIRGYDNFSYEVYTKNAFFNKNEAEKAIKEILPNGTGALADSYHIINGTVNDLKGDKILDQKTKKPLDEVDKFMVYEFLKEKIENLE